MSDGINLNIKLDAADLAAIRNTLAEMERRVAQIEGRAMSVSSKRSPSHVIGRQSVLGPAAKSGGLGFMAASAAAGSRSATRNAVARNANGSGLSIIDKTILAIGIRRPGGPVAIGTPVFGAENAMTTSLINDPSTGGWNRSQFRSLPTSSSPIRGLMYRARAIAAGNPLVLARSALAVYALKQAGDSASNTINEARKHFTASATNNFNQVGLAGRDALAKEWETMSKGASAGAASILSLLSMSASGFIGSLKTIFTTDARFGFAGNIGQEITTHAERMDSIDFFLRGEDSGVAKRRAALDEMGRLRGEILDRAIEISNRSYQKFLEGGALEEWQRRGAGPVEELDAFFRPVRIAAFSKASAETVVLDSQIAKLAGLGDNGERGR